MSTTTVINPSTGKLLKNYQNMNRADIDASIKNTKSAQTKWAETDFATRKSAMLKLGETIRNKLDELATIITEEMGKPITQARAEINKCATLCDFYANNAEKMLEPELIKTEMQKSMRCFNPLGIIFAIMPWNFPFWQVLRFAVPNIMAGNAGILKHAPNSTGAALAIEKLFLEAGFPKDLFRSVVVDVDLASYIIAHDDIAGVTLTGSERAGTAVGAAGGKALKKVVLELGGSDPYLILEDADLDLAAEQCVISRLTNAGQICISAKRLIVVESVKAEFLAKVQKLAQNYQCGDPMLDTTTMGPIAREDLRTELHKQVQDSIVEGAICLQGGEMPAGDGFFYPVTILDNVKHGMTAYHKELFGPVICILTAKDEAEAIRIANDSPYGLGSAVFTKDIERGEKIAMHKINAGTCNVNTLVSSDPRLPFGGIKKSGYGRELSVEALREFMNVKTVCIR